MINDINENTGTLYGLHGNGAYNEDNPLAFYHPASEEAVQTVLDAPLDDDGRSEWRWYRLVNGDLILGVAPHGETHFEVEVDAESPA